MAASDATAFPIKNAAWRVYFPILDADGDLVTGASGLDSEISKDGGTFADCTNEATEIATNSGVYYLDLTSTEMNADAVAIIIKTSTSGAKTTTIVAYPDDGTRNRVDVRRFGGTAGTFSGGRPEVNTTHAAGTAWGSGAITAASIATDAITAAKIATGAIDADAIADNAIDAGAIAANAITAAKIATDAIGAAQLAADAVTEIQSGLATAASLATVAGYLDTEIADIKAKTDNLPSDPADASVIAGRFDTLDAALAVVDGIVDDILTDTGTTLPGTLSTLQTSVDDVPTNAELATALAAADDAVLAAIAALNNLSAAEVNAEVVDALNTDTYAEPGQGAPGATISLAAKIGYLYKAWRNKKEQTASEHRLFNDDATTVGQKSAVSDDGTTATRGEVTTGA